MLHQRNYLLGIGWMIGNAFLGACLGAVGRVVAGSFSPFQIICLINLIGVVFLLPRIAYKGTGEIRTRRISWFLARSFLEMTGWFCFYHAVVLLPLPLLTSLTFLNTLFLSLCGALLLKEHASYHSWLGMAGGITGMVIILRPDFDGYYEGALYMVMAASSFTCCGLIIKKLIITEPPFRILFYMLLLTGLCALPPAMADWQPVPWQAFSWVVLLSLCQLFQQYCVPKAFRLAPLTVLMPFYFTALIFSAILAYIFFDEIISLWTILGASIILASALYTLYGTMARHKSGTGE